jgi:hypothetical protein
MVKGRKKRVKGKKPPSKAPKRRQKVRPIGFDDGSKRFDEFVGWLDNEAPIDVTASAAANWAIETLLEMRDRGDITAEDVIRKRQM